MSDARPQGKRFSQVYLPVGELLQDSPRMRRRLSWVADKAEVDSLQRLISSELGVRGPTSTNVHHVDEWFAKANLTDVLDVITIIFANIKGSRPVYPASLRRGAQQAYGPSTAKLQEVWLTDVRRILKEERVSYSIDDLAGVHLRVDEQFERGRSSTIASLAGARYENASERFEAGIAALDALDGKEAIRGVFHAAEGLFRLMFGTGILGTGEADRHLRPIVDAKFATDVPARTASQKVINAFQDWIVACHQYRHEPGTEELAQPPLSLAITLVSQGASFIRWLIEFDPVVGRA